MASGGKHDKGWPFGLGWADKSGPRLPVFMRGLLGPTEPATKAKKRPDPMAGYRAKLEAAAKGDDLQARIARALLGEEPATKARRGRLYQRIGAVMAGESRKNKATARELLAKIGRALR